MNPDASTAVLVFAKAPEPGRVKTRLAAHIGEGPAAVLAARLALRALATTCAAGIGPVELWCAPDTGHPFFDVCRRRHDVGLRTQTGPDLGARMAHALGTALSAHSGAILVGTDVPSMTVEDLRQAAAALAAGDDAVFGPAEDGGYWLVGLRRVADEVFASVPWSTDTVLAMTRQRCAALGWRVSEIATRWDVDRPEDLARLRADPQASALVAQLPHAA
jgi:uncharacterized protein